MRGLVLVTENTELRHREHGVRTGRSGIHCWAAACRRPRCSPTLQDGIVSFELITCGPYPLDRPGKTGKAMQYECCDAQADYVVGYRPEDHEPAHLKTRFSNPPKVIPQRNPFWKIGQDCEMRKPAGFRKERDSERVEPFLSRRRSGGGTERHGGRQSELGHEEAQEGTKKAGLVLVILCASLRLKIAGDFRHTQRYGILKPVCFRTLCSSVKPSFRLCDPTA